MKKAAGVCILLLVISACSTTRSYVEKGNALFKQGKYEDASINYRKAIQKDAQYGEAYYRLGLSAIKQDKAQEAYASLTRAVQLQPQNKDAKEKLADVYLSVYLADPAHPKSLYAQLTQMADGFLSENPNSYKGLMLKGYLATVDRKSKEAIDYLQRALRVDRSNAGVVTELARLLIQDGQVQQGEKLALDLVSRDKTYGPVYDLLYLSYTSSGRGVEAEKILQAKVDNNPTNADYVRHLAEYYYRAQKPAEMKATLQRLLDDPTHFPDARLQVGDFYNGVRNFPEALRYYEEGARTTPKEKATYEKREVAALLGQAKKDEALQLAARIVQENPNDAEALHLRADLLLDTRKPENGEEARREFQLLLDKDPDNPLLRVQLGRALKLKGDVNGARDQLKRALNKRPDLFAARAELAELALANLQPDEALQQSNEILKARPNDSQARHLHARALLSSGDQNGARAELTRLVQDSPHDTEAQLDLGLLALRESKFQEATNIFNGVRNTGDARAYAGLAAVYVAQRQLDKAIQVLGEGLKVSPGSPIILEQLARTAALNGQYDVAIAQYKTLLSANPASVPFQQHLAEVYELKGDHDNAIRLYRQASELAPYDNYLQLAVGDALARAGRFNEAKVQYQDILKKQPDNPSALNDLAFLLADSGGDLDQALKLAQRALAKIPNQPAFSDTLGYIYLKKGQHEIAMQAFNNLVRKYPHYPAFRYHLGLLMYEKGDKASAKKELQTALADHPSMQDKIKITELLAKIS